MQTDIPLVKAGETVEVPFWTNQDLIIDYTLLKDVVNLEVNFVCTDKSGNAIKILSGKKIVCIDPRGLYLPGAGEGSDLIYGIKVDTSKRKYSKSENISEIIGAGEILVLPICFYPDKACNMTFKVGFEIENKGKQQIVYSDPRQLEFYVSSCPEDNLNYEADTYMGEAIGDLSEVRADCLISYPYINKFQRWPGESFFKPMSKSY